MARINVIDQKNLWGSAASAGGLEPQRADLWYVDMSYVLAGLASQTVSGSNLFSFLGYSTVPVYYKQFAQSVSMPDIRMKPEVYRRDSVPFNMPSWDDPLDAIKITFLTDSSDNVNASNILKLLRAWAAVCRAGRGDRSYLYQQNWIPLNDNFSYEYAFPIRIALLRGGSKQLTNKLSTGQKQVLSSTLPVSTAFEKALEGASTAGSSTLDQATQAYSAASYAAVRQLSEEAALYVSSQYILKNAWLAGLKISDLNYAESKPVTVEATVYAESINELNA